MPDIPQFQVPLTFTGAGFATVEQGSNAELAQRVEILCRTPLGWLDLRPDFGLADQAHLEGGADVLEVDRQIARHVPEAARLVEEDLSALNAGLALVDVQVGGR